MVLIAFAVHPYTTVNIISLRDNDFLEGTLPSRLVPLATWDARGLKVHIFNVYNALGS